MDGTPHTTLALTAKLRRSLREGTELDRELVAMAADRLESLATQAMKLEALVHRYEKGEQ